MIAIENVSHWAGTGVMRVGLLPHAPQGRSLELRDAVSVFVPSNHLRLSLDASTPGRRYHAVLDGPAISVLPPCVRLELEEVAPGPLLVMALESGFVRERLGDSLHMRGTPQAIDPYLSRIGRTLKSALSSRVVPSETFLRYTAENVREHLYRCYTRRARRASTSVLAADRLANATAFMSAHFGDRDLDVERIAAAVGLSPFHFTRLFTKAAGKAPHAYLTDLRMREARRLLADTCIGVAEVARRCGYATHAHFTGVFGRHNGVAPAAYRNQARADRATVRARPAQNR